MDWKGLDGMHKHTDTVLDEAKSTVLQEMLKTRKQWIRHGWDD
jgi:hypothetical protein